MKLRDADISGFDRYEALYSPGISSLVPQRENYSVAFCDVKISYSTRRG
jgi:hypothetical protein